MNLLELPYLAFGAPAEITVAGVPQIQVRDLLKAARRVESRSHFVG